MVIKILNLYAGIGGNRKLWPNEKIEVTAVEFNQKIADVYKTHFPNDIVIVDDVIEYLLKHFQEFDFIWASPPCPTHSRMRLLCAVQEGKKHKLPDMILYSIIIFLKHFFKGNWVVENVISYYEPLIKPYKSGNHYFWSNFFIPDFEDSKRGIIRHDINFRYKNIGFNLSKLNKDNGYVEALKEKMIKNCVRPELGLQVFNCFLKQRQKSIFDFD